MDNSMIVYRKVIRTTECDKSNIGVGALVDVFLFYPEA